MKSKHKFNFDGKTIIAVNIMEELTAVINVLTSMDILFRYPQNFINDFLLLYDIEKHFTDNTLLKPSGMGIQLTHSKIAEHGVVNCDSLSYFKINNDYSIISAFNFVSHYNPGIKIRRQYQPEKFDNKTSEQSNEIWHNTYDQSILGDYIVAKYNNTGYEYLKKIIPNKNKTAYSLNTINIQKNTYFITESISNRIAIFRKASQEEIQWLNACIKAKYFVPKSFIEHFKSTESEQEKNTRQKLDINYFKI